MAIATLYTELDLDLSKFQAKQKKLLEDIKKVGADSETALQRGFTNLGITSDGVYKLMVEKARVSYERIAQSAKKSADEQFRAQSAMVAKINSLNQQMTSNPLYETLGIKSQAAYKAQEAAIMASYNTIKNSGMASSEDLIRIERAKNAKLKELNNEMVGSHEMSMASMMRAVLRFYAAWYVASTAVRYISAPFIEGFKAVEQYNTSVASMASMVVTFGNNVKNLSLEDQWKGALAYSTKMIPVLEQIASKTLLSGQETTALANAFARGGVFLQANNKEAIEGFTRLSNALPLLTQGQEIMRQINTEIRGLLTGMDTPSSMLLMTLKSIDPEIEKHLAIWRAEDTVLVHIGELLKGFGPATKILENQWTAVKTTISTTFTILSRDYMAGAYGDFIKATQALNKTLEENQEAILKWADLFVSSMKGAGVAVGVYLVAALVRSLPTIILWGATVATSMAPLTLLAITVGAISTGFIYYTSQADKAAEANKKFTESIQEMTRADAIRTLSELTIKLKEQEEAYEKRVKLNTSYASLWVKNSADQAASAGLRISSEKLELENTKSLIALLEKKISMTVDEPEAAQKANTIVRNLTKQIEAEYIKGKKESLDEYQKTVDAQVAAFRKGGASEVVIAEYVAMQKKYIAQKFASDITKAESDAIAAAKKEAEAVKRLYESWENVRETLQNKIAMEGLNDLEKKLFNIRIESEKLIKEYKSIPGAVTLIKKVQVMEEGTAKREAEEAKYKDILADIKKAESELGNIGKTQLEKDLAVIKQKSDVFRAEKIDEVTIARWAALETQLAENQAEKKAKEDSEKFAKDKADAYRTMYGDMKDQTQEYYNFQVDALQKEAENYIKLTNDKVLVDKWYLKKKKELDRELALSGDNFYEGAKAQYEQMTEDLLTWGKVGATTMEDMSSNMQQTFSTIFMDVWDQKLKTAEDYFMAFKRSIAQAWADLMSEMITQWIRQQVITGFLTLASAGAGGGAGVGFAALGASGGSGMGVGAQSGGFTSAFLNHSGWAADDYAQTRNVPLRIFDNAQRYHDGIGPDERPAIIRKDEGVFTQGQMKAIGGNLSKKETQKTEVRVDIANINSPEMFDAYMASPRGKNSVLNILSSNPGKVSRIIRAA